MQRTSIFYLSGGIEVRSTIPAGLMTMGFTGNEFCLYPIRQDGLCQEWPYSLRHHSMTKRTGLRLKKPACIKKTGKYSGIFKRTRGG